MVSEFTKRFQNDLRKELARKVMEYRVFPGEEWLKIRGKKAIPVDIALRLGERFVLLEIESHRQDPSNNIAKIPFWLERNPVKERLLIIQLFSPFYDKHKIKRGISEALGKLIMEKYPDRLLYRSLSFQPKLSFEDFEKVYDNPAKNADTLSRLVKKTAERIVELLSAI